MLGELKNKKSSTYREIREVKAFGLLSMFGNIGGYIGIFIGYALLNLPDVIEKIIERSLSYRLITIRGELGELAHREK